MYLREVNLIYQVNLTSPTLVFTAGGAIICSLAKITPAFPLGTGLLVGRANYAPCFFRSSL